MSRRVRLGLLLLLPILGLGLWLGSFTVNAAAWTGRVVGIHDGDTLTVLRNGRGVKLRLYAVDAPELGQAFGQPSRKSLSNLCFGRSAQVTAMGEDKYGRTLARVECGGLEVNAEQLRRGMAWHYAQYNRDPALQQLEAEARRQRLGLWSDRRAEPPWSYRHGGDRQPARSPAVKFWRPSTWGCGNKTHCSQMSSCEEARYYLNRCGVRSLDRNRDGTPCETLCNAAGG